MSAEDVFQPNQSVNAMQRNTKHNSDNSLKCIDMEKIQLRVKLRRMIETICCWMPQGSGFFYCCNMFLCISPNMFFSQNNGFLTQEDVYSHCVLVFHECTLPMGAS